jgi:hypothetical protein
MLKRRAMETRLCRAEAPTYNVGMKMPTSQVLLMRKSDIHENLVSSLYEALQVLIES